MSDLHLTSTFGTFELKIRHYHPKSSLRAWDAADEYVLQHVADAQTLNSAACRVLLVNDTCGALAVSLSGYTCVSWGDYETGRLALRDNLKRNNLPLDSVAFVSGDQVPEGPFDLVIVKLPKTLSLLYWQLGQLASVLAEGTPVIGAGMVKHMPRSMIDAFSALIAPCQTSLAQKKARLIFATRDDRPPTALDAPIEYAIPDSDLILVNAANVFSQQKLDLGTRFLLTHFPDLSDAKRVVDLGCGNGALAVYAGHRYPDVTLYCVDDSFLAIQSARASFEKNALTNTAYFVPSDGLSALPAEAVPVDAILCNPPFHEGNKVHTEIALRMFQEARRALTPAGVLTIVANRHLGYHDALKKWFRQVSVNASNSKFVVISARQPRST